MKTDLLKISIRQNAIAVTCTPTEEKKAEHINNTTALLLANCSKLGFTFSEQLLHAINSISPIKKLEILDLLKEITGVKKNWTPLVKQWDIPTEEGIYDHLITLLANIVKTGKGTNLPCGHIIPQGSFPLERYNGCPFCGAPFEFETLEYEGGHSKLKTLDLWTEADLTDYLISLLESPVALDATQIDSLKILLSHISIPEQVEVKMKETAILVIDTLVENGKAESASKLFKTPSDILRYLWYKHTGFLQIIEPKTIKARIARNGVNLHPGLDASNRAKIEAEKKLLLKFSRSECKMYAHWINSLQMNAADQCEIMHPKRGIWVRVIRALRLAEYSKRKGFERLAELMDTFYNQNYEVWQGKLNEYKLKSDAEQTLRLLKQRPGLFARSLFSTMLWFGAERTIDEFKKVMDSVPARLIFTLNMYAEYYFDASCARMVKPLGGVNKRILANKLLAFYPEEHLKQMKKLVQDLSYEVIKQKMLKTENKNSTIYIDKNLFNIPIAIGDRSEQLQDLPAALTGTRFKVEGDTVRLFMQWGEGLPAQHLDMDLSCNVAYPNRNEICSYSQLTIDGCKHSGDIQHIPNKLGTAEYININIEELAEKGAKYITFTCNAYSNGSISPNLVLGWMNSKRPMKITKKGVAYDPTAVQHQVRITQSLTKGMVFGVLDVEKREIIWLEMSFDGQIIQNLNIDGVETLINKLDAKIKIGDLLLLKAEAQALEISESPEDADEVYDMDWALNTAKVSKMFLD